MEVAQNGWFWNRTSYRNRGFGGPRKPPDLLGSIRALH